MKHLVNYSHPCTRNALRALAEMVKDDVMETLIPVHLDRSTLLEPQLQALVEEAPSSFDLFIPPALSVAAGYVTHALLTLHANTRPGMVVMKNETLVGFMPQEIIR